MAVFTCSIETKLGPMTASAENDCLTGLWFAGQKYYPRTGAWETRPDYPVFEALRSWLADYFSGRRMDQPYKNRITVKPEGTAFQKKVWEVLLDIPYGKLAGYGSIAEQLGSHARAVGGAVGRNPVSILIPCHRVVGSAGQLTGYAGGLDRKKALLALEGLAGENRAVRLGKYMKTFIFLITFSINVNRIRK
jgi:methylated-DNA-[protein]-cysteine S-methyltransferase